MIPALREEFNRNYTPEKYRRLLRDLDQACGTHIGFRVSETPCFVPQSLLDRMAQYGRELVSQLVEQSRVSQALRRDHPAANTTFPTKRRCRCSCRWTSAWCATSSGELEPKLVELQAFPSLYGYQPTAAHQYVESYGLSRDLGIYLSGL